MQHLWWVRQKGSCGYHLLGEFGHLHIILYQHLESLYHSFNFAGIWQDYFNAAGGVVVYKSLQWAFRLVNNFFWVESNSTNVARFPFLRRAKVPALKGRFSGKPIQICWKPPMLPLENWQGWVALKKLGLKEFLNLQPFAGAGNVNVDMGATIQGVSRDLMKIEE